jgi:hypothetical protein
VNNFEDPRSIGLRRNRGIKTITSDDREALGDCKIIDFTGDTKDDQDDL